jgi:16S rRNA U1498 N3-methylase RsmE
MDAGFHPAHLGGTVLRVETAAIYAIAAVQSILQERDAWTTVHRR